jgi:hypothetical protein
MSAPTSRMTARSFGKDADHVGAAFDFAVQPFERICAADLRPVLLGKGGVSQDIVSGFIHQRSELGSPIAHRVSKPFSTGYERPRLFCWAKIVLIVAVTAGRCEAGTCTTTFRILMDTATLKRGVEDLRCGRPHAPVIVGDGQLDAAQTTIGRKPFQKVSASNRPVATPSTSRRRRY